MQVGDQERPVHKKCVSCGKEVIGAERTVCDEDGGMLAVVTPEPQPGDVFADRYEIIGLLGDGGWGKVYKAQHKLMKRSVAIKVLLPHLVKSQQALKRFQQEARAASSLNHPNVMTVFDFGLTVDGLPFLVMDLLEGVSLSAVLQSDQYLPVERSLRIFMQVCEGLAHAHEKGVIHRDVKPNNLMLVKYIGQSDFVKIVDFGIAKLALPGEGEGNDLTQTGEIFGSPMYMSPEQCRGKELDARSDIYSTGCVLYRCLAGRPAFVGRDAMECMFKQVHDEPEPFRDACPDLNLPAALEVVVFKALAKDPESRFQNMIEFRDALMELYRDIIGGDPVTANTQLRLYAVTPGAVDEVVHDEHTGMFEKVAEVAPSASSMVSSSVATDEHDRISPAAAAEPPTKMPIEEVPKPPQKLKSSEPEADEPELLPQSPWRLAVILTAVALLVGIGVGGSLFLKNEPPPKPTPTQPTPTQPTPVAVVTPPPPVSTSGVDDAIKSAKASIDDAEFQKAIAKLQAAENEVAQMPDQAKAASYLLQILPMLGQCYLDIDNPDAARDCFEKVAPKQKKEFGEQSPQFAKTETSLAIALNGLGDYEAATPLLNHALSVIEHQPEGEQKGLCDVYYGLAKIAEANKDFNKANELLSEALKRKQAEGEPDVETANLMVNVAQVYMARRQYPKAKQMLEQALEIEKTQLGEDSTFVAGTMKNLAIVYYQTGEPRKAEELFKKALDINNRFNASDSLFGAEIMNALAILYGNEQHFDQALPLATKALAIRKKMLGLDSPLVKKSESLVEEITSALKSPKHRKK